MPMPKCTTCNDFGYVQTYQGGRVARVYCVCEAGDKRVEIIKQVLRDVGLDPEDSQYIYERYKIVEYR